MLVGCRRRNGHVAIQVIDTGVGIAPSDQKAVFEEFHRLTDGAERTKRGLGLGLAIVDRIARLLGHEISLRSEIGKGSCFEVVVPRAVAGQIEASVEYPLVSSAPATLDDQAVLCIDNEREILDAMYGLLRRWGAAPLTATSREEALAAMTALHAERGDWPALLLVDYHLDHRVTGLEIIEALRNAAGHAIPAAIVTADHSDEVAEQVSEAGHTLLRKPVKPAALRALVNRVLSRRSAA